MIALSFYLLAVTSSVKAFSTSLRILSCSRPSENWGFLTTASDQRVPRATTSTTSLEMLPLSLFKSEVTFFKEECSRPSCCIDQNGLYKHDKSYELCLAEEADLVDLSKFIVETFGAEAIRLSADMGAFERMLMKPAVEFFNGYSGIIAFAEVLAGISSRLSARLEEVMDLSPPKLNGLDRIEKINVAAETSIILVLAKRIVEDINTDSSNIKTTKQRNGIHVIGSVELRLQPCDAKIPFSLPWLDRIERVLASLVGMGGESARDLQPYLSNLCVDENHRGRGIGKALVRCVEDIAVNRWGYSRMYLHVDVDNKAALMLYQNEGYRDVGRRWNPFWAGRAADIGYFVKDLEASRSLR